MKQTGTLSSAGKALPQQRSTQFISDEVTHKHRVYLPQGSVNVELQRQHPQLPAPLVLAPGASKKKHLTMGSGLAGESSVRYPMSELRLDLNPSLLEINTFTTHMQQEHKDYASLGAAQIDRDRDRDGQIDRQICPLNILFASIFHCIDSVKQLTQNVSFNYFLLQPIIHSHLTYSSVTQRLKSQTYDFEFVYHLLLVPVGGNDQCSSMAVYKSYHIISHNTFCHSESVAKRA